MAQQAKKKGGIKLRRCAIKAAYYTAQYHVTERNKARRAARVRRRAERWKPQTETTP